MVTYQLVKALLYGRFTSLLYPTSHLQEKWTVGHVSPYPAEKKLLMTHRQCGSVSKMRKELQCNCST